VQTDGRAINAVSTALVTFLCIPWVLAVALAAAPAGETGSASWASAVALAAQLALDILQKQWRELLFLGLVVTAFGTWAQTLAQRIVPASFAAVIYALDPFWGCLIAGIWLGERLGSEGLVGASLLLIAVIGQLVYQALGSTAHQ